MLLATAAGKGAVTLEEIAAAGGVTLEQARGVGLDIDGGGRAGGR